MSGMNFERRKRCPVCGEPTRSVQPKHEDGMCDDCLFATRASIRAASGMNVGPDDDPWANGNGCLPGAIVSGYVLRSDPRRDYVWTGTEWQPTDTPPEPEEQT